MREYLFRGEEVDSGEWSEGSLWIHMGKTYILTTANVVGYEVDPETVGQYTGLKDKNGVKIFEGDIVTMPAYLGGKVKAVVYFQKGKFAVDGSHYRFKDLAPKGYEVIGNIYDNPELLKEGGDE